MKILTVFALEEESFPLCPSGAETIKLLTGIGKTQAAATLALAIKEHQPIAVLNIGTVGTYRHQVGDILIARHFIDRDMKKLPIDGVLTEIDMSALSFGYGLKSWLSGEPCDAELTINTGDNFVFSSQEALGADAVDMESFALAWVCKKTHTPFLSIKYVTDILGQNSIVQWADKLAAARQTLSDYFKENKDTIFLELL